MSEPSPSLALRPRRSARRCPTMSACAYPTMSARAGVGAACANARDGVLQRGTKMATVASPTRAMLPRLPHSFLRTLVTPHGSLSRGVPLRTFAFGAIAAAIWALFRGGLQVHLPVGLHEVAGFLI